MKTRIGIITVSRTNNFGAELQAFALHKKLQLLGYDAEVIDYLYYKHKDYKSTKGAEPIVEFTIKEKLSKFILYKIITPFIENVGTMFVKSIARRTRNFEKFHTINVKFSKQYRSLKELNNTNHNYDVFMVGSDQVWNPETGTSLAPYFLSFAPKDKLKVSYASSFGVSEIDRKYHEHYKQLISNLDIIAVRENEGVQLISSISGKSASRVLDPTLLLDKKEWENVISEPQKLPEKFILIYQLHDSNSIFEWANYLSKRYKLQIFSICKRGFYNKKYSNVTNIEDAGPSEFIELFSKAAFVVTNSFHGTAFSVNFKVPFITVLKKDKKNNSRMLNFLSLVDLDKRIVWENDNPADFEGEILMKDFSTPDRLLELERVKSIDYLESSMKNG